MVNKLYKIVRFLIVTALLLVLVIPAALQVLLSVPAVHTYVSKEAGKQLSILLDSKVSIESVNIAPFNKLTLRRVVVEDCKGDTALKIRNLGVGVSLRHLIARRKIVVDYLAVIRPDIRLSRDSLSGLLNIQNIIDALKPKDPSKPPTDIKLQIRAIVIRDASVSYDVASLPYRAKGLDVNHLSVDNLSADLRIPEFVTENGRRRLIVDMPRLALDERSGIIINRLSTRFDYSPGSLAVNRLEIEMPGSLISFNPIELKWPDSEDFPSKESLVKMPLSLSTRPECRINPSDAAPFLPPLEKIDLPMQMSLSLSGTPDRLGLDALSLFSRNEGIEVTASGYLDGIMSSPDAITAGVKQLMVKVNASKARTLISLLPPTYSALSLPGTIEINADGSAAISSGKLSAADVSITLDSELLTLSSSATVGRSANRTDLKGSAKISSESLSPLTTSSVPLPQIIKNISGISAELSADMSMVGSTPVNGIIDTNISSLTWKDAELNDIMIYASVENGSRYNLTFESDSPLLDAEIEASMLGSLDFKGSFATKQIDLQLTGNNVYAGLFTTPKGILAKAPNISATASGSVTLSRRQEGVVSLDGLLDINDFTLSTPSDSVLLSLRRTSIEALSPVAGDSLSQQITLTGDLADASLTGRINTSTIVKSVRNLFASVFPSVVTPVEIPAKAMANDFDFSLRLLTTKPLEDAVSIPFQVRYPVELSGHLSDMSASMLLSAPYLWQGNKEINDTRLEVMLQSLSDSLPAASISAATKMPTKNGSMTLNLASVSHAVDSLSTDINWVVESTRDFSGQVELDTRLSRSLNAGKSQLDAKVIVEPGHLTFNDTVWTLHRSEIEIEGSKRIAVNNFLAGHDNQFVKINGIASPLPSDSLTIDLSNVDLDYVFETLNIPNAMFGGIASGHITGNSILSSNPVASTSGLYVEGLKYNFSLLGNTMIRADFDAVKPAVNLHAIVSQPNGRQSFIDGYIKPTTEGYIDLDFKADKIAVGFMKPFMAAFASEVSGFASGNAHLFGTFKDVNMSGDIYAEDLKLKLDFTGTSYTATDSVHLTPGYIDLNNITLHDRDGHTARLDGWLSHTNFHYPKFNFRISNAASMLVYDIPPSPELIWYGTIYGDGAADINGVPGKIDIKVDMATAPASTFTFVLSDSEQAYDYTFITFRDRLNPTGTISEADASVPEAVRERRKALAKKQEEENASIYDMDLTVRANPNALLTVVMDPVGGDAIKARGNGVLTLTYNSASEDLGLRGDYTLESGSYNFTFQDIIRKDFKINPGSEIRFMGDPYAARLNIAASYRLTANLSDLDESFLDDPELTRTTVPVDAMILVNGDMRSPGIDYDFNFPTLKDDIKRKVNSIVSTDDMRARQMLYLLALNRFYTPDYITATKGNEFVSMASSTLSSQLGNALGQLTDKLSIAPNIRSDRGDFSDMEFDLALGASLLNNRLLFNGNFGYRDKTLNNNAFIGDFDIEYLLNRSGSLRFKAYNRYNDQNFYVKNALTTQGLGFVYKRDFDSMLSFLKALRRKPSLKSENTKK